MKNMQLYSESMRERERKEDKAKMRRIGKGTGREGEEKSRRKRNNKIIRRRRKRRKGSLLFWEYFEWNSPDGERMWLSVIN